MKTYKFNILVLSVVSLLGWTPFGNAGLSDSRDCDKGQKPIGELASLLTAARDKSCPGPYKNYPGGDCREFVEDRYKTIQSACQMTLPEAKKAWLAVHGGIGTLKITLPDGRSAVQCTAQCTGSSRVISTVSHCLLSKNKPGELNEWLKKGYAKFVVPGKDGKGYEAAIDLSTIFFLHPKGGEILGNSEIASSDSARNVISGARINFKKGVDSNFACPPVGKPDKVNEKKMNVPAGVKCEFISAFNRDLSDEKPVRAMGERLEPAENLQEMSSANFHYTKVRDSDLLRGSSGSLCGEKKNLRATYCPSGGQEPVPQVAWGSHVMGASASDATNLFQNFTGEGLRVWNVNQQRIEKSIAREEQEYTSSLEVEPGEQTASLNPSVSRQDI